jgi:hypothetical protein
MAWETANKAWARWAPRFYGRRTSASVRKLSRAGGVPCRRDRANSGLPRSGRLKRAACEGAELYLTSKVKELDDPFELFIDTTITPTFE